MKRITTAFAIFSFVALLASNAFVAHGGTYRLMGEQDTSIGTAGDESIIHNYDTYADLLANSNSSFSATQVDWGGGGVTPYSTVGLAYDGCYRLMGEQDTGTGTGGDESYIYTYNTYADLLANNYSFSTTQINWTSTYATAGLAYDGKFRLMGEQDTSTGSAGNESIIYTYDTHADLLANNWSSNSFTQIDWGGGGATPYSTVGLAYDGKYRLMGEQDTGTGTAGDESYIYTYDTFADLLANNYSFSTTQINWSSTYATAGLAYEPIGGDLNLDGVVDAADAGIMFGNWGSTTHGSFAGNLNCDGFIDAADAGIMFGNWTGDVGPAATAIPEPTTLALVGFGLSFIAIRRRR